MTKARTWWNLRTLGRKPDDYDVATTGLLYYPRRGFAVQTPVERWYRAHQAGSALRCRDWDAFRDPRATTYASYVALQNERETFVDGLLESADETGTDARLDPAWLDALEGLLGPARFPFHGLQMVAAYAGSMAPGGRVVVACALQAADEMRRVQRFAYRTRQLQEVARGFGDGARGAWERDPAWQPLRELVERLLVTWDWGEALAALNLAVKPRLDGLFMLHLGELARASGDDVLFRALRALYEDCAWHLAWTRALVTTLVADDPANARALAAWLDRWAPRARAAVEALAPAFDRVPGATPLAALVERLERDDRERRASLGIANEEGLG